MLNSLQRYVLGLIFKESNFVNSWLSEMDYFPDNFGAMQKYWEEKSD